MTLKYEANALLPRQNGKTTAAYRALKARVEDLVHNYGVKTELKVVFWCDMPRFHVPELRNILGEHVDKVIVTSNLNDLRTNRQIYDFVLDTSKLSVPNVHITIERKVD